MRTRSRCVARTRIGVFTTTITQHCVSTLWTLLGNPHFGSPKIEIFDSREEEKKQHFLESKNVSFSSKIISRLNINTCSLFSITFSTHGGKIRVEKSQRIGCKNISVAPQEIPPFFSQCSKTLAGLLQKVCLMCSQNICKILHSFLEMMWCL